MLIIMLLNNGHNVSLGKMSNSKTMLESRMDSSRKYPKTANLFYISQFLELRCINKLPYLMRKRNKSMNRVPNFSWFPTFWILKVSIIFLLCWCILHCVCRISNGCGDLCICILLQRWSFLLFQFFFLFLHYT